MSGKCLMKYVKCVKMSLLLSTGNASLHHRLHVSIHHSLAVVSPVLYLPITLASMGVSNIVEK